MVEKQNPSHWYFFRTASVICTNLSPKISSWEHVLIKSPFLTFPHFQKVIFDAVFFLHLLRIDFVFTGGNAESWNSRALIFSCKCIPSWHIWPTWRICSLQWRRCCWWCWRRISIRPVSGSLREPPSAATAQDPGPALKLNLNSTIIDLNWNWMGSPREPPVGVSAQGPQPADHEIRLEVGRLLPLLLLLSNTIRSNLDPMDPNWDLLRPSRPSVV